MKGEIGVDDPRAGDVRALLAVGALKDLGDGHGELKSMHTDPEVRGRGIARTILDHLVGLARAQGLTRLSLETGSMEAFAPARALYARAGFAECGPFADYALSSYSTVHDARPGGRHGP